MVKNFINPLEKQYKIKEEKNENPARASYMFPMEIFVQNFFHS